MSREAMTMQFGIPATKSCTWPGPTQTAVCTSGPSSSSMTVVRRLPLPISRPFMARMKGRDGENPVSRSCPAKARSCWALMEMMQTSALCRASAKSSVRAMDEGRVRYSFFPVQRRVSRLRDDGRPHKVTVWPMRSAYQAWKAPQRPQPKTVIFMSVLLIDFFPLYHTYIGVTA